MNLDILSPWDVLDEPVEFNPNWLSIAPWAFAAAFWCGLAGWLA